ncbi:MAG: GntR family transcriptional regulator [Rubrimonas sp.]
MSTKVRAARSPALRPLHGSPGTPLWLQVKHALRDLTTFDLRPGDRLPAELSIGAQYGVSRVTVRQAIEALADEGLIERRRGVGAFVAPPRLGGAEPDDFLAGGFDAAPVEEIELVLAEPMAAPGWIAARLETPPDCPLWKLRTLWRPDRVAAATRTAFTPRRLAPELPSGPDLRQPLHRILERDFECAATSADETIEYIQADSSRAALLEIRVGAPLLLVERLVRNRAGRPLMLTRTYFCADRFRFARTLRRAGG